MDHNPSEEPRAVPYDCPVCETTIYANLDSQERVVSEGHCIDETCVRLRDAARRVLQAIAGIGRTGWPDVASTEVEGTLTTLVADRAVAPLRDQLTAIADRITAELYETPLIGRPGIAYDRAAVNIVARILLAAERDRE